MRTIGSSITALTRPGTALPPVGIGWGQLLAGAVQGGWGSAPRAPSGLIPGARFARPRPPKALLGLFRQAAGGIESGRLLVGVVTVAMLCCSACWCGAVRAESGTVHTPSAVGLNLNVDTRWVDGSGYRPVKITIAPARPLVADRVLTFEFSARRQWPNRKIVRVVQDVEIPAGSGPATPIRATMSIPQMIGWNTYQIIVLEDGRLIRPLTMSASGTNNPGINLDERLPGILVVGDKLPDTTNIGRLMSADGYDQFQPQQSASSRKLLLPTAIARPAAELPRRWIDYSCLDVVCISLEQLKGLATRRPETFRAIVEWTAAGGNLFVSGVGEDWEGLPELESLVELGFVSKHTPGPGGWTEPERSLFGRAIRGIGSDARGPFEPIPKVTRNFRTPGVFVEEEEPDDSEPDEPPPVRTGPPEKAPFVYREFEMGLIVAMAPEDPFAESAAFWAWVFNSVGATRFLGYQRHGLSSMQTNPEFLNFLIPGVGIAPINAFCVLITLFVLAIGPTNYFLLRRWKRLYMLVVTVPAGAAAVTGALFGYAIIADGLGTRVRVRSVTQIDQRIGRAVCWSRLSYYAGLAPGRGLTMPEDVAVIPLEYNPMENRSRPRELIWQEDQWLAAGWLRSRTPTQFVTVRSRPAQFGLEVRDSQDSETAEQPSDRLTVTNRLGTEIHQLLLRTEDGRYYWATDVATDAVVEAKPVDPAKALELLRKRLRESEPKYPAGIKPESNSYSMMRRRTWMYTYTNNDMPKPIIRTSCLELALYALEKSSGNARAVLETASYVAVVEKSPEVELGTPVARQEASLHVIMGKW